MRATLKGALAGLAFLVAGVMPSVGSAFPLTATLTGDPRTANPDNLRIDVTIASIDSNTVQFTIDINSPLHPNAKLDEFYFNLVAGGSYTFDGFDPVDWAVNTPASVQGGGSIAFSFEALDPSGPPDAADVTNTQNLVFNMNLLGGGSFTDNMFLLAGTSCSSDQVLGCGQLGAHLQSLTIAQGSGATTDSGFLLGNYSNGVVPPTRLPEPGSMALVGVAFLAVALSRTRRRQR